MPGLPLVLWMLILLGLLWPARPAARPQTDSLLLLIEAADRAANTGERFRLRLDLYQRLAAEGRLAAADSILALARRLAGSNERMQLYSQAMEILGLHRKGQTEAAWRLGLAVREKCYRRQETDLVTLLGINLMRIGRQTERLDTLIALLEADFAWLARGGHWSDAGQAINHAAILSAERGDFTRGLRNFEKALAAARHEGQTRAIAQAQVNIGIAKLELGDPRQALREFEAARRLLDTCRCNPTGLAHLYFTMGSTQAQLGDSLGGYANLHRGLAIYRRENVDFMIHSIILQLARHQLARGQVDSVQLYLAEARRLVPRLPMPEHHASHALLEAEVAYTRRDFEACSRFAAQAYDTYRQLNKLIGQQDATRLRYRADSSAGRYRAALDQYQLLRQIGDSLRSETNLRELGRLEARLEADKQLAIQRAEQAAERERSRWALGSAVGGLLVLALLALMLFRGRRKERRANAVLRHLNQEIAQQKSEIEAQHEEISLINAELQATLQEVSSQRQALETQHLKIEDSIRYASRIQRAILPDDAVMARILPPHLVHYQPRDIVSGDFYWAARVGELSLLAAVDCTGHGVPGAFMSVVGANLLQQLVVHEGYLDPEALLGELDRRIVEVLRQELGGQTNDGMDLAVLVLHPPAEGGRRVDFAGGGRPLWWLRGEEVVEVRSGPHGCGGRQQQGKAFPRHTLTAQAGDRLYLFSDGVTDQFGGAQGRKLGTGRLRAFLLETRHVSIKAQGAAFADFFASWQGNRRQLDDVLLLGLEAH